MSNRIPTQEEFKNMTRAEKFAYFFTPGPFLSSINEEGEREDSWIHDEILEGISEEAEREQRIEAYNHGLEIGLTDEESKESFLEESDYPFIEEVTKKLKAQYADPNYDPWKD